MLQLSAMLRNFVFSVQRPKTTFARYLRKHSTTGERILWQKLRAKRFHGLVFRRQVPIGPYIVDFLCVKHRLVIEVDGDSHYALGAQERDARREQYLCQQGFRVLRFGNAQVVQGVDTVIGTITQTLGFPSD